MVYKGKKSEKDKKMTIVRYLVPRLNGSIKFWKPFSNLGFLRYYHPLSSEYDQQDTLLEPLTYKMGSIQSKVLSYCLKEKVPKYGFTEKALVSSINDLGYDSSMLSVIGSSNSPSIFHSSTAVMELLKYNLVTKRYNMIDPNLRQGLINKNDIPSLETLLLRRLEMDKQLGSKTLTELMAKLSIPSQLLLEIVLPELFRLADDMIYFSNEKDHTDIAWYTKRLGVSLTYVSSKLFMSQDKSNNYEDTMDFAKWKLNKVMKLGDYYNNIEEYAWYTVMTSYNLIKSQFSKY